MTNRQSSIAGIDTAILPETRDLTDGFKVQRAVPPSANWRMIGPFILFDILVPKSFMQFMVSTRGHILRRRSADRSDAAEYFQPLHASCDTRYCAAGRSEYGIFI
ncbi:hypothetical protein ACWGTO_23545 [Mesorhizobium sp. PL10]